MLIAIVAMPIRAAEEPKPTEPKVTRLTLHPAPEPRPALKYQLLPTRPEQETGNAAVLYNSLFDQLGEPASEHEEQIEAALKKPLSELPKEELLNWWYSDHVGRAMKRAARQSYCDWQLPIGEGIDMLLPSLSNVARTGDLYAIRARLYMAEGKLNDALGVLQAGMALGQHVGQDVTVIQGMVGSVIQIVSLNTLNDWVQQPGAPNLYWALTCMPDPLIDFTRVTQYEPIWLDRSLPVALREKIRSQAVTGEEAAFLLKRLVDSVNKGYPENEHPVVNLDEYKEASDGLRKRLLDFGYEARFTQSIPAEQVHVLYTLDRHRELVEEQTKWLSLPYHLAKPRMEAAFATASETTDKNSIIAAFETPWFAVARLHARQQRVVVAFRIIEAIRMYAADHGGKLPPTLDAITKVPVPMDPMTGKPFVYELKGEAASLQAPDFEGSEEGDALRYELTIAP